MAGGGGEAVVLSGSADRYGDPWHPFEATSGAIANALAKRGLAARIETDADRALAEWSHAGARHPSLLVVNIGWYGEAESFPPDAIVGLEALLTSGVPILVVHSSLTAFPNWPRWEQITGGRWVYDVTYHPDAGPAQAVVSREHPITSALRDIDIVDERYTRLRMDSSAEVFLEHDEAGERHPLAWTHRAGSSRVISDALGHDRGAYGAGRLMLLEHEIDWLLSPDDSVR
jgi:type 1 glutamine amidotransferase